MISQVVAELNFVLQFVLFDPSYVVSSLDVASVQSLEVGR